MDNLLTQFFKRPWKAYCISLPRCTERRQRFTEWAQEIGLTFQFWDAVDKRDLATPSVLSGGELSLGATACRLSHEALWRHIVDHDTEEFFFLLEDDAGFKSKTFQDLTVFLKGVTTIQKQKPWSILHLGFGTMTGSDLHLLSKRNPPGIFQTNFCDQTHAMLYTRQAIQTMLTLSRNQAYTTRPSDGLLLAFVQTKKGLVLAPKQSIVEQTDTVSYISKE